MDKSPEFRIAILDVRQPSAFEKGHRSGAVNIALEELTARIHELPSRHAPVCIYDDDARRARWAVSRLRARGRDQVVWRAGRHWLLSGPIECGRSMGRLWSPHSLLLRGLEVAESRWGGLVGRRALDIACGTGRDAVSMALHGMSVEAWDILPDALERCRDLADRNGVRLTACVGDVECDLSIEDAAYDAIVCFNFLHRPLMASIARGVRPGGIVVYETFVEEQRRLFGKPRSDLHLLKNGELCRYFPGWEIIHKSEGLAAPRRFVASLIAFRPV
ncbi:MAG: methyltransferase domain-containing protein [Phycisphaerae bacterium]|nr:methyltransferase domain-containing protein [Phycisphaerae bacterium]